MKIEELYFKNDIEWRKWLSINHANYKGVNLVFYKVTNPEPSMKWEEAVKVALQFGWIDSTVKSLGNGKRIQYFSPRKPKSIWSAVNKKHIELLIAKNLMHQSGLDSIQIAKENGSWDILNDIDKAIIPEELQKEFDANPIAFNNFKNFAPSYRKNYLYWLKQAKREETKQKRLKEIIRLSEANIKLRN